MPDEFGALHSATRTAVGYLGKLESKLREWDRNITSRMNQIKGKKAKNGEELKEVFEPFESAIPKLEKMEAAGKTDEEDKINYQLVFKKYKEMWDEIFMPFSKDLLKKDFKFENLSGMKRAVSDVKKLILALLKESLATDSKSSRKLKIKFKDASWAHLSNTIAKTEDGFQIHNDRDEKGRRYWFITSPDGSAYADEDGNNVRFKSYKEAAEFLEYLTEELEPDKLNDDKEYEILKFEEKISGTRVEYIGERPEVPLDIRMKKWREVPETMRKIYWWMIPHTNMTAIPLEDGLFNIRIEHGKNKGEILESVSLHETFIKNLFIFISYDDQMTFWVYENDKKAWAELVDYFGNEEKVLQKYIRWYH